MKNELTTKDLTALNELMTFENWLSIKMLGCHDCVKEASLKTAFQQMAKEHYDNHIKLLNYLKANSDEEGGK